MKNPNASQRATALVHEVLDVLRRAEQAPDSPVNTFLTAEMRRKYRREAKRLRGQKVEPRYKNLHSAEELAGIYERTVRRDEMIEQGLKDFQRLTLALGRVLEENDPEVERALAALFIEAKRSAEEDGPGSEAAQRYWRLQFLGWFGERAHTQAGVIADASPLIALNQIGQISLIEHLFDRVLIATAVAREVSPSLPSLPAWIIARDLTQPIGFEIVLASLGAGRAKLSLWTRGQGRSGDPG